LTQIDTVLEQGALGKAKHLASLSEQLETERDNRTNLVFNATKMHGQIIQGDITTPLSQEQEAAL